MPALHDLECSRCGTIERDTPVTREGHPCRKCKGRMEILWQTASHRDAVVHSSERAALFYSAKEKKWQYPARSDQPISDRLKRRGYERVELGSLHALEQHGKQTGAISHVAWFDKGSGRSFDGG